LKPEAESVKVSPCLPGFGENAAAGLSALLELDGGALVEVEVDWLPVGGASVVVELELVDEDEDDDAPFIYGPSWELSGPAGCVYVCPVAGSYSVKILMIVVDWLMIVM
jgi:hypothetical protein